MGSLGKDDSQAGWGPDPLLAAMDLDDRPCLRQAHLEHLRLSSR